MTRIHVIGGVLGAIVAGVVTTIVVTSSGGGQSASGGSPAPAPVPASADPDLARVPHNANAAIYDVFGASSTDSAMLDGIQSDLESEGYTVTRFADTSEGAGSQGTATLTNFISMADKDSVIVVNAHGEDFSGETQACVFSSNHRRSR